MALSLFEATGIRTSKFGDLHMHKGLPAISPTSVDAEQAFSAADLFRMKIRPWLSDEFVDSYASTNVRRFSLGYVRGYYPGKNQKFQSLSSFAMSC